MHRIKQYTYTRILGEQIKYAYIHTYITHRVGHIMNDFYKFITPAYIIMYKESHTYQNVQYYIRRRVVFWISQQLSILCTSAVQLHYARVPSCARIAIAIVRTSIWLIFTARPHCSQCRPL